uniref:Uncharacterized protein n=1 Tax=Arundo donax TaxID=35708 RepID=A0A0A9FID6_ARUDO
MLVVDCQQENFCAAHI